MHHGGYIIFYFYYFVLTFQPKVSVTFLSLRKTCLLGCRVLKPKPPPLRFVKPILMDEN